MIKVLTVRVLVIGMIALCRNKKRVATLRALALLNIVEALVLCGLYLCSFIAFVILQSPLQLNFYGGEVWSISFAGENAVEFFNEFCGCHGASS